MKFARIAAMVAGLALPLATAHAATYTSKLEYKDGEATGHVPSYGLVTIDELDANNIKVTVSLTNAASEFVNTGGGHEPFLFSLTNPFAANVTVYADDALTTAVDPANFFYAGAGTYDPPAFDEFTNKIGCCRVLVPEHTEEQSHFEDVFDHYDHKGNPVYKKVKVTETVTVPAHYEDQNGAGSHGRAGPIYFKVHDDAGITFAGIGATFDNATGKVLTLGSGHHFLSNDGLWWFAADIYDGATGSTGEVAAKDAFGPTCVNGCGPPPPCPTCAVPEPDAWALMVSGFGAAGALIRRRRGQLA